MTISLSDLSAKLLLLEERADDIRRAIAGDDFLDSRNGIRTDLAVLQKAIDAMRAIVVLAAFDTGELKF